MKYKKGDTPAPGLKIIGVIEGTAKDSFSHYIFRRSDTHETFESDEHLKQIYVGRTGKRVSPDYGGKDKEVIAVDEVRVVGNPDAAKIYFHIEGEIRDRVMMPAEFDEFLEKYIAEHTTQKVAEDTAPEGEAEPAESVDETETEAEAEVEISVTAQQAANDEDAKIMEKTPKKRGRKKKHQ